MDLIVYFEAVENNPLPFSSKSQNRVGANQPFDFFLFCPNRRVARSNQVCLNTTCCRILQRFKLEPNDSVIRKVASH